MPGLQLVFLYIVVVVFMVTTLSFTSLSTMTILGLKSFSHFFHCFHSDIHSVLLWTVGFILLNSLRYFIIFIL